MNYEKFKQKAENSSEVTDFLTYKSKNPFYDYYYHCVGYLNGNYFSVIFKSYWKEEIVEISVATDNREDFNEYFK